MEDDKPPAKKRTLQEQKILNEFAQEEARIYKLYRDYTQNDLKREKKNSMVTLKFAKMESDYITEELEALKNENGHLKKTVKRYQQLV